MAEYSHPLIQPRAVVAVALASICAAGWGLMATKLIGLGFTLSIVAASAAIWLYAGELRNIRRTFIGRGADAVNDRKELVVAICVIVVGIAVPIWLLLAQDLSTQSATTTPLNETWRWSIPVLLALAAFLGFLFGIRERSHGEIVKASLPNGLYVGQIHASFSRFEDDYCIELAVRFYNGTSDIITVGQLRGAIRYGESIDGKRIERELLPAPAFLTDRTNVSNIQSLTETMVVLEQRVPRNIALRMNEVFAAGYIITFDLRTLEIPVSIAGKTDTSTPLPTHSLTFKKEADAIVTNRIAYAVGHATARAATIVQ